MADPADLTLSLLANDLSDAAIHKRVHMLRAAGAAVRVAGFRRSAIDVRDIGGCAAIDLGETRNGSFFHRIWMVLRALANRGRYKDLLAADIVIARNLEMLAVAVIATRGAARQPVIVYEVLDIHRLLLGNGLVARLFRRVERRLMGYAHAVLTSSPAYISEYFRKLNPVSLPIRLIENKIWQPTPAAPAHLSAQPPWIIGWFGIIRCRKSLHLLADIARKNAGKVEIVIRGRPALDQIPDFYEVVETTPGLRFDGAYKHPDDLAAMYGAVHFNWAIDMYEEGLNSSWHLPNRLYEGGAYHAVPIAIENLETGAYLKRLGIGVLLPQPLAIPLQAFLSGLTSDIFERLSGAAKAVPPSQWVFDIAECRDLLQFLAGLKRT